MSSRPSFHVGRCVFSRRPKPVDTTKRVLNIPRTTKAANVTRVCRVGLASYEKKLSSPAKYFCVLSRRLIKNDCRRSSKTSTVLVFVRVTQRVNNSTRWIRDRWWVLFPQYLWVLIGRGFIRQVLNSSRSELKNQISLEHKPRACACY